ncbi:MAG TPA: prepilin-type N-terminal cleavage/methylation domain-containing protein [Bdellovibrionales bacterium]|nr:prepilin-type N-terminal cleavage/methylation domain-containing protein [Bdellovibrionales bacterium]
MKKLNNKGFSLVELMVVVAIIGILSAIAIPNFQRFQRKSRQSEAKSMLGAIYTAEKTFHQEWNSYIGALDTIGYIPSGQLRYRGGFTAVGAPNPPVGYQGPAISALFDTVAVCGDARFTQSCTQMASAAATMNGVANPAGTGNGAAFTAAAVTNDPTIMAVSTQDEWTMTHLGVLTNSQTGI